MQKRTDGFTLVELLVVIGLIGLLIALLLPALKKVRAQSNLVACQSNLGQIGAALRMYANDNRDHYPDALTTGNHLFRMKPGLKTIGDPGALPEVYGIAALLHGIQPKQDLSEGIPPKYKYLPADSKMWICRSQPDWMIELGNTYAFSGADVLRFSTSIHRGRSPDTLIAWDNYSTKPGLSGFRGPFSSYNLPSSSWQFPHRYRAEGRGSVAELRLGGSVALRDF